MSSSKQKAIGSATRKAERVSIIGRIEQSRTTSTAGYGHKHERRRFVERWIEWWVGFGVEWSSRHGRFAREEAIKRCVFAIRQAIEQPSVSEIRPLERLFAIRQAIKQSGVHSFRSQSGFFALRKIKTRLNSKSLSLFYYNLYRWINE